MLEKLEIRNKENELLEAISEGQKIQDADEIIVMVHGFGTSLHERGLFDDISKLLIKRNANISVIRFSWPGFGESEGKQEETTLLKVASCVTTVLDFVFQNKKPETKTSVLAHSMGNRALSRSLATNNFPLKLIIAECPSEFKTGEASFLKWSSRPNTTIDENGVMITPRADGTVTRIGQGFWKSIDPVEYREDLTEIAKKYDSILIRALEDPVVDNSELKDLPFTEVLELHGDHVFSKPEDRSVFLEKLYEVLEKK